MDGLNHQTWLGVAPCRSVCTENLIDTVLDYIIIYVILIWVGTQSGPGIVFRVGMSYNAAFAAFFFTHKQIGNTLW